MSTQSQEKLFTIREAAKLSGLPASTLRYYESIGIINGVGRNDSSGHRQYTQEDINVIDTIACLNATGMPLNDMRTYMENRFLRKGAAEAEIALLEAQKKRLDAERAFITLREQYVVLKIKYWESVKAGDDTVTRSIVAETRELAKALKFPKN